AYTVIPIKMRSNHQSVRIDSRLFWKQTKESILRSATAYFLAGLFVASSSSAAASAEQVIHIQLSSSLNACFIDNVRILCSEVGGKLQAMNVQSNSDIHLIGDSAVGS